MKKSLDEHAARFDEHAPDYDEKMPPEYRACADLVVGLADPHLTVVIMGSLYLSSL